MSQKNTENNELSMDELKDVAGGGMGLDRLGTQKGKGEKKPKGTSLVGMETGTVYVEDQTPAVIDGDFNDLGT